MLSYFICDMRLSFAPIASFFFSCHCANKNGQKLYSPNGPLYKDNAWEINSMDCREYILVLTIQKERISLKLCSVYQTNRPTDQLSAFISILVKQQILIQFFFYQTDGFSTHYIFYLFISLVFFAVVNNIKYEYTNIEQCRIQACKFASLIAVYSVLV